MKRISWTLFWIILFNIAFSQTVTVVDKVTLFGIPGVKVYAKDFFDTLETNEYGQVNIDIFPDDKPIVFYHRYYESAVFTKRQIEKNQWYVKLDRGPQLMAAELSLLSAKEYSFGLPFYVDIVNLDNPTDFIEDNDQGATEKIMFKTDEKGITVFRSLEPNKILLALDGLRLNNEIYKNGKVENALNFERTIVQNVQQIFDPTFLIYGPDGLGGVVHYFTKIPNLSNDYKSILHYSTTHRYESASNSWISNYQISFAKHKFSSYTSITYSNYGDIRSGKNRRYLPQQDSLWGLHLYKVVRIGDRDTMVPNEDPYLQLGTNYKQLYILQKFRYKLNSGVYFMSNFYYTHTSDLGIYSGITEMNRGHPRFAVCKYMPTNKFINNNLIYIKKRKKYFDFASLLFAYQYIEEYRLTRKYNNPVELHQIEHLNVFSFAADFVKIFHISRLAYGVQYNFNYLNSKAYFRNIIYDTTWFGLTRYPTYGTYANWLAGYFHYRNLSNSQLILDFAGRFELHKVLAKFDNNPPQLPLPFNLIDTFYFAPSFSVSIDAYPIPGFQVKLTGSKVTHLPIVDDFGKVMFKDFVVSIPTDSLKPEHTYYSELVSTITPTSFLRLQISLFYSYVRNLIMLFPGQLNGSDSLYLGIDGYKVAVKANLDRALIYGGAFSFNFSLPLNDENDYLKFNSVVNFTKAKNLTNSYPIPNIPPLFGRNSLTLKFRSFTFNLTHIFNGLKPLDELSPLGEDYIEKAASVGFPGWNIFNIKFSYSVSENFNISIGVNNIFDLFYRPYASAINGTGRNFILTAKFSY